MSPAPPIYFYPSESSLKAEDINCNTIVIDGREKLIIDPGRKSRWPELAGRLAADGFEPGDFQLVLLTHSHPDHLEAAEILALDYGLPVALHEAEQRFWEREGPQNLRPLLDFSRPLREGFFPFGGRHFFVYHAPGHSPGSLVLHWPEAGLLVTGDVYFSGTFGATDYPGGSEPDMFETLARLENLSDVSLVLCGHGPDLSGRSAIADNYAALRREVDLKKAGLWPGGK
jgi:glyoxylase-like metal-dependent hydrolase (beta-lactamase superfamily II)